MTEMVWPATASYSLLLAARGPSSVAAHPATTSPAQIRNASLRMLLTSRPIHRTRPAGSSADGSRDLDCLVFGQLALDPDEGAVVVEEQGVGRQAEGVVMRVAVGVREDEVVRVARDPVAGVAAYRDLFDVHIRTERLLEVVLVDHAASLRDEQRNSGQPGDGDVGALRVDERDLATGRASGRRRHQVDLVGRTERGRDLDLPAEVALGGGQGRGIAQAEAPPKRG